MTNIQISSINSLIISSIVIFVPIIFIIPLFFLKKINSQKGKIFLYSFTAGLTIILGSFGFLREAIIDLEAYFVSNVNYTNIEKIIYPILIIVSGVIVGVLFYLLVRFLSVHRSKEIHLNHKDHNHSDHVFNISDIDNKNSTWVAIIALLTHKLIDGLSLGFLISKSNGIFDFQNIGLILIFIIHIIPMTIVIYFFQMNLNISKKKILINIILISIIIIPFIFIGALIGDEIQKIYWLMPFLFSISGSILILMSIIELVPEFIHNRNMTSKKWYITILSFLAGFILSIILSLIHIH